jgi:hypothetical protein
MTRLFTDGAEMGDVLFWDSGTVYLETGPYSSYAYWLQGYSSFQKNVPNLTEFYFRQRVMIGDYRDGTTFVARKGANNQAYVSTDSSTKYLTIGTNTLLATSTTRMISRYVWYMEEIYFKYAVSGSFVVKIDGVVAVSYTGNTTGGGGGNIDNFAYSGGGQDGTIHLDDLALNDTDNSDGKNDDSWCGDAIVLKLTPSGSSATTNNWVNNGGVSASANYLYVDDFPKDDDTTYVYSSASISGNQDQYAMSNLGLGVKKVLRLWTEVRARKSTSDDTYIKLGVLPNGSTDSMSGSIPLTTSYTRITGSPLKLNPATSASWTQADLDGLEAVIEMG